MKRLFSALALVALALIAFWGCGHSEEPSGGAPPPSGVQSPTLAVSTKPLDFKDFPVSTSRTLSFTKSKSEIDQLTTLRRKRDQMLDWMLYTLVYASGLSPDQANKVLYDRPAVRRDYLRPVANFEHGVTRSLNLGDNNVLALIPEGTDKEKKDSLAHVADAQLKNQASQLGVIHVFTYPKTAFDGSPITVRHESTLQGKDLFTPDYGYFEKRIGSREDLADFLNTVDDVTYASQDGGLTLGGRKLLSRSYGKLDLKHIATIWKAESTIRTASVQNESLSRSDETLARLEKYKDSEFTSPETRKLINDLVRQSRSRHRNAQISGTGFSLDPKFDIEKLNGLYKRVKEPLRSFYYGDKDAIPALTHAFPRLVENKYQLDLIAEQNAKEHTETNVFENMNQAVESGFGSGEQDAGFAFIQMLGLTLRDTYIQAWFDIDEHAYKYQTARYDGGTLKGTEVGMTLFYTDLVAKTWQQNYKKSAPTGAVADFVPTTNWEVSPVFHAQNLTLPTCRLWFGHNNDGFQISPDRRNLYFARNATRIFAKSENPMDVSSSTDEGKKEVEAGSYWAAFINWWDDHYEEVARYEPQYERLNEIMKWSLLMSWLFDSNSAGPLSFLAEVPFDSDLHFPAWVKAHRSQLRCAVWPSSDFYPDGYKGETTEAMRILQASGNTRELSGGVSLAERNLFKTRTPVSAEIEPVLRRSNLNYEATQPGLRTFKTLEGVEYHVENANLTSVKPQAKLRSVFGEIAPGSTFRRTVTGDTEAFRITHAVHDTPIGELQIAKAPNGFEIGWASRDVDTGEHLAKQLSKDLISDNGLSLAAGRLAHDPQVEQALYSTDERICLVKLKGSNRWIKLAEEAKNTPEIGEGFQARCADLTPGAKSIDIAWMEESAVQQAQADGNWAVAQPVNENKYYWSRLSKRGPPESNEFQRELRWTYEDGKKEFFQHVNDQLRNRTASVAEKEMALRCAEYAQASEEKSWQYGLAYVGKPGAEKHLMLTAQVQTTDLRSVSAEEALQAEKDSEFYVDAATMNNQHWNVDVQATLRGNVSLVEVYELPDSDIAHFKPGVLKDGSGTYYNIRSPYRPGYRQTFPTVYIPYIPQDDDEKKKRHRVFVIRIL